MMYNILCKDTDGNDVTIKFDNITNTLYSEDGTILVPKDKHIVPKTQYIHDFNGLRFDGLRLMFGVKCNFHCKYCAEGLNIDRVSNTNFVGISIDQVDQFLQNLDKWEIKQPKVVDFRGGEPGVYIKLLERLIPALRERWPDTEFLMLSNGSLINERFVDLLLDNKCCLVISHDAYGQCERGIDPLTNPKTLANIRKFYETAMTNRWGRRPPLKFHVTFNKICIDPVKAVHDIRSKLGYNVPVDWHTMGGQGKGQRYVIPEQTLQQLSQNMLNAALSDKSVAPNDFYHRINNAIDSFRRDDNCDGLMPYCSIWVANNVCMDLNGHVFRCSNFCDPKDVVCDFNKPQTVKLYHHVHHRDRPVCQHCPYINLCLGCCYLSEDGAYFNHTCRYTFYYFQALFCAAIYKLTGLIPYKIQGPVWRQQLDHIDDDKHPYQQFDQWNLPTPQWDVIAQNNETEIFEPPVPY